MFHPAILVLAICSADPSESDLRKRAEELVAQLGDRDFRERERAAKQLLEIGYSARSAVLAGIENPDCEISERCRQIYPVIWRHDLERRVRNFVDRPEEGIPADLPGAVRWLEITGDSRESRELYGRMVQDHAETLLALELQPERSRELYTSLIREVYSRSIASQPRPAVPVSLQPTESEVLLFLFLGSADQVRTATVGLSVTYYYRFLDSPHLRGWLSSQPAKHPARKLFAAWFEKERFTTLFRRALDLAAQHEVKECLEVALRIAADDKTLPLLRSTAILGSARLAALEDLPRFAAILKDKTLIANVVVNKEQGSVQVRDVALGAVLTVAKQDLLEFGFERKPPSGLTAMTSYIYYAFSSEEKREAAHARWQEWAAKNLHK